MVREPLHSPVRTLGVLHLVFALTGILHVVGGALLPSLVMRFHLSDSDSGLLFLLYYAGTSIGALLCRWNYARTITLGFVFIVCCCVAVVGAPGPLLPSAFLLLGISVGIPMSAVSLYVGRAFPDRCASILTSLNFSWSVGALAAPLIAAQILVHHTYRAAYLLFAVMAIAAALTCGLLLKEAPENEQPPNEAHSYSGLALILIFALAAFLEVGVENTAAAWLPTYVLRSAEKGIAVAAASSALYWFGFLSSRGLCSFVLLRVAQARVFRVAVFTAIVSASLLFAVTSVAGRGVAMFLLGAALAPIYPLVIAGSFSRVRRTSDARWILATAGFGGSVLPWLAGIISAHSGSLRVGMLVIPGALLLMVFVFPAFRETKQSLAAAQ
jgi:MFS transporter, FHS family, glucose/mannose:H+ symporter